MLTRSYLVVTWFVYWLADLCFKCITILLCRHSIFLLASISDAYTILPCILWLVPLGASSEMGKEQEMGPVRCVYVCVHMYVYVCAVHLRCCQSWMCVCVCAYACACVCTLRIQLNDWVENKRLDVTPSYIVSALPLLPLVSAEVCAHTHDDTIREYVVMCVCVCVCVFVCLCVCVCVWAHLRLHV